MEQESFNVLYADMLQHMKGKTLYVQDLFAGAEKNYRINIRVISELVWHNLFIRHLLIRPNKSEVADFVADYRASTPTAAIVAILNSKEAAFSQLLQRQHRLRDSSNWLIK